MSIKVGQMHITQKNKQTLPVACDEYRGLIFLFRGENSVTCNSTTNKYFLLVLIFLIINLFCYPFTPTLPDFPHKI